MTISSRFITVASCLAVLIVVGGGCAQKSIRLQTIKSPEEGKAIPQVPGIPEHWSQIGVVVGTSTVHVAFPGVVSPMEGSATNQVIDVDMGTAVLEPKDLAVPTRSLRVYVLREDDKRIKNCGYSEMGWSGGNAPKVEKNLTFGSVSNKFCYTSESEAAMGNRYAVHSFATKIGKQYLVLQFIVHSVVCENFEKPEEQCVAYDEKRDTAIFAEILSELKVE